MKKTNYIPLGSYWLASIAPNILNKSEQGQNHNSEWDSESLQKPRVFTLKSYLNRLTICHVIIKRLLKLCLNLFSFFFPHRIKMLDGLAPFDFKTNPSWINPYYLGNWSLFLFFFPLTPEKILHMDVNLSSNWQYFKAVLVIPMISVF